MRRRRYKARATLPPASPSKAPLFARHLLQSPASPCPLTPDFFFLPPPPPARPPALPGQTGLSGELERSRSHLALPSWPGFSPPLLPGPHTIHGIFTSMDVPTTQAQTSGDGAPLPTPACAQASSCSGAFESRGGQGAAGAKSGRSCTSCTCLQTPAQSPRLILPFVSQKEPPTTLVLGSAAAVKRGGGWGGGVGSEPLPRRAGGASATWPRRGFAREAGAGGRSSWRCEKEKKMPKLAPFILQATFLTHDNNFHLYLSRECEKRALHHSARVPRGCRISRPGGLGPHLRSGRKPRARRSGHGLSLPPGVLRPGRPWGPGGETLAKERREIRLTHLQDAGGWGKENGGRWWFSWLRMQPWLPKRKGQPASKHLQVGLISAPLPRPQLWRELQR